MLAGTRGQALRRLTMKNRPRGLGRPFTGSGPGGGDHATPAGLCACAPLPPPRQGPEVCARPPDARRSRRRLDPAEGGAGAESRRPAAPPHTPNPCWTTKGGEIGRGAEAAGAGRGMQPPPAHPSIGGGVRRAVPLRGRSSIRPCPPVFLALFGKADWEARDPTTPLRAPSLPPPRPVDAMCAAPPPPRPPAPRFWGPGQPRCR